ncbi:MAG: AAA family ATPase [Candidatus Nitrosopolaris sp.]
MPKLKGRHQVEKEVTEGNKELEDLLNAWKVRRTSRQDITYRKFEEWEDILKKQIILFGPNGTGKTFVATEFCKYLTSKYGAEFQIIQFHPSYS